MSAPPLRHEVDDGGHPGREQREEQLEPEEEREPQEPGRLLVVNEREQRQHNGDQQQPVPRAAVAEDPVRQGGRRRVLRGGYLSHRRLLLNIRAVNGHPGAARGSGGARGRDEPGSGQPKVGSGWSSGGSCQVAAEGWPASASTGTSITVGSPESSAVFSAEPRS